ncbi:MAG TPA: M23 family metallopeptidase [Solirubrobacteraceae bacterium]|nr:M23 family metallopeptidase [Solirubrobacteraceae bacterium]
MSAARSHLIAALAAGAATCVWTASAAGATLMVNTTRDELASHDRSCSLREAMAAVDSPGRRSDCGTASRRFNTIILRSARYLLTIRPVGADDDTTGDLNVTSSASLAITGAGTGTTVIDASRLGDRALSAATGAKLTLRRMRITGGHAPNAAPAASAGVGPTCTAGGVGGGILNRGDLFLDTVVVVANRAGAGGAGCTGGNGGQGGGGGGVFNLGRLIVVDSTIGGNSAGSGGASSVASGGSLGTAGVGGSGGGIYNQGTLSLTDSTIYANRGGAGGIGAGSGGSGGGVFSASGRLTVTNSTLAGSVAGAGGAAAGPTEPSGSGGSGGAIAVISGQSVVRSATVAENAVGGGGTGGRAAGTAGAGGGVFAQSGISLENTIVASNLGANCAAAMRTAIANGGHDLSYDDRTCPGRFGNPRLGPLRDNGGPTSTLAIAEGSAAIDRGPSRGAGCPPSDQRGVRRPEGRACDIGAYEFALPTITIASPVARGLYLQGSRILARFRCDEGGIANAIAKCNATTRPGHAFTTAHEGTGRFIVTAIDKSGIRTRKIVRYTVFKYVNPVREVRGLTPRRIDLGVDYAGSGPIVAIGDGVVTMATDTDSGPSSCWAISCWPGGGIVVYRLLTGPFAGRYTYVAEHITVTVRAGQRIRAGQQIATLYAGYPWSEFGWAAGPGPEALGMADGHQCPCSDPGNWSTIDGRTMNNLLVAVGAPSGLLQPTPSQRMPRGWRTWPG